MSDSADQTYEQLHSSIASLRAEKGKLENKVIDLEAQLRDYISELDNSQLRYQQLVKESLRVVTESNRTMSKLVDKMDGGSSW